jgi:hypothetical protein
MSIGKFGCIKCSKWSRCRKTGVFVTETYDDGVTPYQIWMADIHECPGCGQQFVAGFGVQPVCIQHEPDFQTYLDASTVTISGCPGALPEEENTARITGKTARITR